MNMRTLRYISILGLFLAFFGVAFSQTIYIGDVINNYVKVTGFDCAANQVTVTSSAGYSVGDTVLLIQMKGAIIDESNSAAYGTITDTLTSGNYEICIISAITGNNITFQYQVIRDYDPAGAVQLVRVPYYPDNARLSSLGGSNLTATPWDPVTETGGVLAFIVGQELSFANNRRIDVISRGFTGGQNFMFAQACGLGASPSGYGLSAASLDGGFKGEGMANYNLATPCGRGKLANGGGGGNDHNTGGGGGGNGGAGGIGGLRIRPGGFNTCRGENPGIGGTALSYNNTDNKIWMGGGGGAGHASNTSGSNGGSGGAVGGGIVLIRANVFRGNNRQIRSYANAAAQAQGDGAGGGGSGGTVLIETNNFFNNITVDVFGGRGGNQNWSGANNTCMGTGGGGGGGIFWHSGVATPGAGTVTVNAAGGNAGIQVGTCAGDGTTGAAPGNAGATLSGLVIPQSFTPPNNCVLPVMFSQIRANQQNDQVKIVWSTASEINNEYFIVERSTDGENFSEIGRHPSNGNSDSFTSYTLFDEEPKMGNNFYRIRQVDFNGQTTVSGAQKVKFHVDHQLELQVFPNPIEEGEMLRATFVMPYEGFARIRMSDAYGRPVFEQTNDLQKGFIDLKVPTEAIPTGIYFLKVNTQDFSEVRRVSIIRK